MKKRSIGEDHRAVGALGATRGALPHGRRLEARRRGKARPVQGFAHWGWPDWMRIVVGAVEVISAVLLLIPRASFFGARRPRGGDGGSDVHASLSGNR